MFQDILLSLSLEQNVHQSTHTSGHTLDVVLTRTGENNTITPWVQPISISDHALITYVIHADKLQPPKKQAMLRSIKRIDRIQFISDLSSKLYPVITTGTDINAAVSCYNSTLSSTLDLHAPSRKITLKGEDRKPWYTDDIHQARQKRRQLERRYKKRGLEVDKQLYLEQCHVVVKMITTQKSSYYKGRFQGATPKVMYSLVQGLLSTNQKCALPSGHTDKELADEFALFFHEKVQNVRRGLEQALPGQAPVHQEPETSSALTCFTPVTEQDIHKLIKSCPSKSCSLDPVPTYLLKEEPVLNCVTPAITTIINTSIAECDVPDHLKVAHIVPYLKKKGLDQNVFKNYRPVSNLPFLHKVLEKVVAKQLMTHLTQNHILDDYQSAYRTSHSTESAILKIKSDIDLILDQGDAALLVTLDLSAAFDTIDHQILLSRLESVAGINGAALSWIKSYLTNRSQCVTVEGVLSESYPLAVGVPQGSCLGPLLFLLYVTPLKDIIAKHQKKWHGYADDTQLYCRLQLRQQSELHLTLHRMNVCLGEVREWMSCNLLKLNDSKTECIVFAPKSKAALVKELNISVTIGGETIIPVYFIQTLGSTLDSELSMSKQISNTTKSAYYHLRQIGKVRQHLDRETCKKVVHSTVTSRIDYHNALLTNATAKECNRLQLVQNSAARLITGTRKFDHITPILYDLHWLPVQARITFKALTFIHKALHTPSAPSYLKDLVSIYEPARSLRSADDPWKLSILRTKTLYGASSFPVYGATEWNKLSLSLRSTCDINVFKSNLKTILFKSMYY